MKMSNIFLKQRGVFLVLFVIALAALMAIVLFGNMLSSVGKRADDAARNQESFSVINAALIQFIQLNLRLPCPASGLSATGLEDTTSPANTVTCLSPSGVVPWTTLGLSQAAVQDSWGRMFSYRVYDGATGFTRANGLNLSDCLDSDVSPVYPLSGPGGFACNATTHENARSDFFDSKGLSVNDRGTLKTQVAYALISHGASGYGAYAPASPPTRLTMPTPTSKELLNANTGGAYWILDPSAAGVTADDTNHFDDIVSYAVASDLVMVAKAGGRAWPLATILDRVAVTGQSNTGSGTINMGVPSEKVALSGGPLTVYAFAFNGSSRTIASVNDSGVYAAGATGNISNHEGLGFDFRVQRRILKVTLASFIVQAIGGAEQAQFTFFDGATQVAQINKSACHPTGNGDTANFVFDIGIAYGKSFTKVEIADPTNGSVTSFGVASIAACQNNDSACILPGSVAANDCP
jgi:type II secretory pathway pseudopilin PulG